MRLEIHLNPISRGYRDNIIECEGNPGIPYRNAKDSKEDKHLWSGGH